MRLKNKAALITGGNSGIGLATARRFVAEGARVAITGRDAATLAAAANELGVTAIRSDVLDAQARSSLFDRIKDEFGHLDILFANAGIAKFSPIEETLEKDFDDVLRTNVTAVFLTVQAALRLMGPGASGANCRTARSRCGTRATPPSNDSTQSRRSSRRYSQ